MRSTGIAGTLLFALGIASSALGAEAPAPAAATPAPAASPAPPPFTAEGALLPPVAKPITGLSLDSKPFQVVAEAFGDETRPVVLVQGRFTNTQVSLMCGQGKELGKVTPDAERGFELRVTLSGPKASVRCFAVDIEGEMEEQNIGILFSRYGEWLERNRELPPRRLTIAPSLGYSLIQYTETGTRTEFTLHAVTAKVSATYLLLAPWMDVGGNIFLTALPISISGTDATVRYLGFNAQAGFTIPKIPAPWRLTIKTGFYYNRMFVSGAEFGYLPALSWSIAPALRRSIGSRDAVLVYAKYVPVPVNEPFSYSLANREIGAGASWTRTLSNGHPLSASFDFANLKLFSGSPDDPQSSTITTTSMSLSVGYGL